MKRTLIVQDSPDEHVFIEIECAGLPTVSIDLMNYHCRRGVGIRVDGMGILNALVDVKEIGPNKGGSSFRYCGMCGEKLERSSSLTHECPEEQEESG